MGCCNGNTCELYASESNTSCGTLGGSCSACASGQECNKTTGQCVCDATSCANGCCNGNTCVQYSSETPSQCGKGGAACGSCTNGLCDTTNGTCSCDSDTCPNGCCVGGTGGTCELYASESNTSCGAGGATCATCGTNLACDKLNGQCVCNASSCPLGCCNGNTCVLYASQGTGECGTGGATCTTCGIGDTCSSGQCTCGGGGTCAGCCNGSTCEALTSESSTSCGSGGAACEACPGGDTCNTSNGQCVCNASSCPNGCCSGTTCIAYASESNGSCGAMGAACTACGSNQACDTANGECVCNATTCAHGCCNGNACVLYGSESPTECGAAGAACQTCTNGVCDTTVGTCSCDVNTCLDGCCNGGTSGACVPYASETSGECGSGGASCGSCGASACVSHTNGLGQTFDDCTPECNPTDLGGNGVDCEAQGALDACDAYSFIHGGTTCTLYSCGSGYEEQYIYMSDTITSGLCSSWSYYIGTDGIVGQVFQNTSTACTYGCDLDLTGVNWQ
jgi:hypothetical protein